MDDAPSDMENVMLRKMSIAFAVIALSITAVHTNAFARYGGGGSGGGHVGGFGGAHIGAFAGGYGGGHVGAFGAGRVGAYGGNRFVGRGGFVTHPSVLHFHDRRVLRHGWGGWGWGVGGWCDDWPYGNNDNYGDCY